ncbi:MAG: hypothetical protein GY835_13890 [bacterium]|nr:hypothetical protein [bacterium]
MSEERFEELLKEAARQYNEPPKVAKDEMWHRIARERRRDHAEQSTSIIRSPWLLRIVAAAAVLLFGIGIGRMTLRQDAEQEVAEIKQDLRRENAQMLYDLAAAPYLTRAETLLTQYSASSCDGEDRLEIGGWAGSLLTETRLLLDSPAGKESDLGFLLQDLELVLMQIRQSSSKGNDEECQLVRESMKDSSILTRLRAKIPAGQTPAGV